MSIIISSLKLTILFLALATGYSYYLKFKHMKTYQIVEEWAEKNKIVVDRSNTKILREFQIPYDEAEWKKLVNKLENTKYFSIVDEKYVKRHEFGFDPDYSKVLVDYWKSKFDWKKQVNQLNRYKQYQIDLNDTTIHFVRTQIRPDSVDKNAESIKIILIDGWPGSFFGFYKMLDYLTEKRNENKLVLDIIVPSIPGYGYSTPLRRPIDTSDTAFLLDGIMRYLHGEDVKYFTHGEDWGSAITNTMAQLFPNRVRGMHLTMPLMPKLTNIYYFFFSALAAIKPSLVFTEQESKMRQNFGFHHFGTFLSMTGYFHLQATKPDTLGHAMTDSPVGLMAYILEKYSLASFDYQTEILGKLDGGLDHYEKDELLTIITFYWMTNCMTSSMRLYKTAVASSYGSPADSPKSLINGFPTQKVPLGVLYFRNEIMQMPEIVLKSIYNLKKIKLIDNGGHFASFQNPVIVANEFTAFIKSLLN